VESVKSKQNRFLKFNTFKCTVWDMFEKLSEIIDDSDPDFRSKQTIHAFQTAESLRKRFPEESYDWFWLVGLIHDLGKILAHPVIGEPQWAVVGDTYGKHCK
jgi:inositol oxygenase